MGLNKSNEVSFSAQKPIQMFTPEKLRGELFQTLLHLVWPVYQITNNAATHRVFRKSCT